MTITKHEILTVASGVDPQNIIDAMRELPRDARLQSVDVEEEQWRPIPGYEGAYEVSDRGRVRSLDRVLLDGRSIKGRMLKQSTSTIGYRHVSLRDNGIKFTKLVHRAVLEAFVGPCPDGMETCHGEGGPSDNWLTNLRWGTHSENNMDRVAQGTHHFARRRKCVRGHSLDGARVGSSGRICLQCPKERRRERLARSDFQHSTYTGYRCGCRCDGCRASNAAYQREQRRRKRERNMSLG